VLLRPWPTGYKSVAMAAAEADHETPLARAVNTGTQAAGVETGTRALKERGGLGRAVEFAVARY
jgi:hypothetical protein